MALSKKQKAFIGIVAFMIAVIMAAPFAWRAIKEARARNLADDAKALLDDERYPAAWEAAKAAYALNPTDLEVARTLAGIVNLAQPTEAPTMWRDIYAQSGEEEDLVEWFDSVLRLADKQELNRLAERLATDFPQSPEAMHRQAQAALHNGKTERAIELSGQAARAENASEVIQFFYVRLSQRSDQAETRNAGLNWLREMSKRSDETGLKAARMLLSSPEISRDQLLQAAAELAKHPKAERQDLLTEIVLRRNQGQQSAEELINEVKDLFELENPEELVELGRWLNQQGRSADFLQLVDGKTAEQRRDLFLVWLDAMALDRRWEELQPVMERPSIPLEPFTRVLFRARIQQELGNERIRDLIWKQALLEAEDDIGKLQFAYDYAVKLQWDQQARDALDRLLRIPRAQRVAYEQLIDLGQETNDVDALRADLRRMAEAYPNDLSVANDLAYLNLLVGEDMEASAQTALRLLQEAEQPFLAHRITLALAYYQGGQHSEALDLLYPLAINWEEARPGWRAVYAAILAKNGYQRESQDIMKGVNVDELLPPEREILREARQ